MKIAHKIAALALLASTTMLASAEENNVPKHLHDIKAMLGDLSSQLTAAEGNIRRDINSVAIIANGIQSHLDANFIDVKATVCVEGSKAAAMEIGKAGEVGSGNIPAIKFESKFEAGAKVNLEAGVKSDVCFEVPIYQIVSDHHVASSFAAVDEDFEAAVEQLYLRATAEQFNDISWVDAMLAAPALDPIDLDTSATVVTALDDALSNPLKLKNPILLAEYMLPEDVNIAQMSADILESALSDPCGSFAGTPMEEIKDDEVVEDICAGAKAVGTFMTEAATVVMPLLQDAFEILLPALEVAVNAIESAVNVIKSIVDAIYDAVTFDW